MINVKTLTTSPRTQQGAEKAFLLPATTAWQLLQENPRSASPNAAQARKLAEEFLKPDINEDGMRRFKDYSRSVTRGAEIHNSIARQELARQVSTKSLTNGVARTVTKSLIRLSGPLALALTAYEIYEYANSIEWKKRKPSQQPSGLPEVGTPTVPPKVPGKWVPRYEYSYQPNTITVGFRDIGIKFGAGTGIITFAHPEDTQWEHPDFKLDESTTFVSEVGYAPDQGPFTRSVNGTWQVPPGTFVPGTGVGVKPKRKLDTAPDYHQQPTYTQPGHVTNPERRRLKQDENTHPYAPTHRNPDVTTRTITKPNVKTRFRPRTPGVTSPPKPKPAPIVDDRQRPMPPPMVIGPPGTVTDTTTRPDGTVRPPNDTHTNSPPAPGDKERKVIANPRSSSLVSWLVGTVTESIDFIEALHDALPKDRQATSWYKDKNGKWRKANPSAQKQLDALYKNIDKLDVKQALKNVLINQLQDALIGKLGSRAQKEAKPFLEMLGRPVGFQTGGAI